MAEARSQHRDFTGTAHLAAVHGVLPSAPDWVMERRAAGLQRLELHGFPGSKDEDWLYTSARPILKVPYTPALGANTAIFGRTFLDPTAPRFVLVDGQVVEGLGRLADGRITAVGLKQAFARGERLEPFLGAAVGDDTIGFDALNTAFLIDGTYVDVPDGCVLDQPLHIVHVHTGDNRLATVRNVVRVGRNAEVTIVEHYLGHGEGLTSAVTEILTGENARVRHAKVQEEHPSAFHVGTIAARLARDARLDSFTYTTGAALSRTDLRVGLDGPGAGCTLDGLYMLRDQQHADLHTEIDHTAPHTTSRELYKGILDDRARGVFTGAITVRPDAQHIDSAQRNNNLLLGERAVANSRPILEIFADDVKCAHGATVGRIDPDARFYLRQRGLDMEQARALLTWAFAGEALASAPEGAVRTALESRVRRWLKMEDR